MRDHGREGEEREGGGVGQTMLAVTAPSQSIDRNHAGGKVPLVAK